MEDGNTARFAREESGSVALIFVLALIPLMAIIGAAIDYSQLTQSRSVLQQGTDTAILTAMLEQGAAITPTTTEFGAFNAVAKRVIVAATGDPSASVKTTRAADGTLCVSATRNAPLYFGGVLGRGSSAILGTACASGSLGVEIAIALDNSGSMAAVVGGRTKLDALVGAVGTLLDEVGSNGVAVSAVPFASAVNVGSGFANANWMDKNGQSSTHWSHYTRPASGPFSPNSRFDLFAGMSTPWGGCVEERSSPYLVTDTAPTPSNPDTLFVPYLAPDEPGAATGSATAPDGNFSINSYLSDSGGSCTPGDPYATADASDPTWPSSGMSKLCKYDGQAALPVSSGIGDGFGGLAPGGPNFLCPGASLQTLTADQTLIRGPGGVLNRMVAFGDTNLLSGFMWAWRTISPNGPFASLGSVAGPGLRKPRDYSAVKILVMMTDGMNHWVGSPAPLGSIYTSLGYFSDGRLSDFGGATNSGNFRQQMDDAFLQACTNAKNAGVKVYTVAFDTPDSAIDAPGKAVLASCASQPSMALSANDPTSLTAAFSQIANGVKKLRLTR